jgi:hypothetical protein
MSSKTSVYFQQTIPEDRILENHRCENLKSYMAYLLLYFFHLLHITTF